MPKTSQQPDTEPSSKANPDESGSRAEADQASNLPLQKQLSAAKLPKETREFMKSRMIAANFGNIVTVLMQSAGHKNRKLSELREMVVPALINNQFRIAEAHKKGSGHTLPMGVILWARVSDDVDKRLSDVSKTDVALAATEWVSGDNFWIIDVVGEQKFVASMLQDLNQKDFKDKTVKYRRKTEAGIEVATLTSSAPSSE